MEGNVGAEGRVEARRTRRDEGPDTAAVMGIGSPDVWMRVNVDGDDITAVVGARVPYGNRTANYSEAVDLEDEKQLQQALQRVLDKHRQRIGRAALKGAAQALMVALQRGEEI